MRRVALPTVAIAVWSAAFGLADEMTYSTLSIAPAVAPLTEVPAASQIEHAVLPASFAAPPYPEIVESGLNAKSDCDPSGVENISCEPQISCPEDNCRRWFGGIDLGSTRVNHSNGSFALDKNRTGLSLRPYFGCEDIRGVGFRAQVWLFGAETQTFTAGTGEPFDLETGALTIDLDMYKRLQLDTTSLVVGVGSRVANIGWTFPNDSRDSVTAGGLSAFVEGYHPYKFTQHSEWGCIGGARISAVSGRAALDNSSGYSSTDGMIQITDVHMGIQYRRFYELSNFLLQLRLEKQFWDTNVFGDVAYSTTGMRMGWEW